MPTKYPAQIDNSLTLPIVVDNVDAAKASTINTLRDTILAIESVLGTNPAGIYSTIRNRFSVIETAINGGGLILSGDLGGLTSNVKVIGIQNIPISNTVPTNGQVLAFNGTMYIPTSTGAIPSDATTGVKGIVRLAGDLGGTAASPSVLKVNGVSVSGTPINGQIIQASSGTTATWTTLAAASPDATTGAKGIIQLAGDMGGTAALPLNLKINGVSVPASPSAGQVLTASSATAATWSTPAAGSGDATTVAKGVVQLAGDLGGTAALPNVLKINGTSVPASPSNGQVLTATGGGSAAWQSPTSGAPVGASYLTLAADGTLTSERIITAGTNIGFIDGGAGGLFTINSTYSYTPTDATTGVKGVVQLAGDLAGTAALPTVLKINGTSVPATPTTGQVLTATSGTSATWQAPAGAGDATTIAKGVVQLAGDLAGTAAAPSVSKFGGVNVPASAPTAGYVYTAISASVAGWVAPSGGATDATTGAKGIVQLAGDLAGTAALPSVAKINGISVATGPAAGQVLTALNSTSTTWSTPSASPWTPANTTLAYFNSAGSAQTLPIGSTKAVYHDSVSNELRVAAIHGDSTDNNLRSLHKRFNRIDTSGGGSTSALTLADCGRIGERDVFEYTTSSPLVLTFPWRNATSGVIDIRAVFNYGTSGCMRWYGTYEVKKLAGVLTLTTIVLLAFEGVSVSCTAAISVVSNALVLTLTPVASTARVSWSVEGDILRAF